MQQRQTPSGSGIRLIDDDERSNWVGQCESTKDLRAEIGGVMSQVAHEDYEDARLFNFLAQISERIVGGPGCTKLSDVYRPGGSDRIGQRRSPLIHLDGTNK